MNYKTFTSEKIIDSFEWIDELPTVEWCKENIYLNRDVTPYTGMINFDRTPWVEEILNDWDKTNIEQYNIMASTQVAKTTIQFCCITKELDTNPCMMQLTVPTDDMVSDFLDEKLNPFMRGIKRLQDKIQDRKEEEKTRLKSAKKLVPNGALSIVGNTAVNRRSKSVRNMFIDEASLFEKGNIKELIGRTKFYEKSGRKIFIVSSRKFIGDEIENEYNNSYCKKELQILCKECNQYFYPTSKHFKYLSQDEYKATHNIKEISTFNDYKREAIKTAVVECDCGHKINDDEISDLVRNKQVKLVIVEGSDNDTIHGYKLNALATALTKYSTIAQGLIEAGDDPDELQTIHQDYFNETLDIQTEVKTTINDILTLSNGIKRLDIHKDTNTLHLGVDLQKNRLYYVLGGIRYGDGMILDIVSHGELFSEGIGLDWDELEEIIDNVYLSQNGKEYRISSVGIDIRGFALEGKDDVTRTQEALNFIFDYSIKLQSWGVTNPEEFIYPTVGHGTLSDKTKDFETKIRKMKRNVNGEEVELKLVDLKFSNIKVKNKLSNMIERNILKAKSEEGDVAYDFDRNLFYINEDIVIDSESRQLLPKEERLTKHSFEAHMTSEHRIRKTMKNGRLAEGESWEKKYGGIRNDYWDCCVSVVLQSLYKVTYRTPLPIEEEKEDISNLLSAFR